MAEQSPINTNINVSRVGLNTDSVSDQIQQGELRYALNAITENFDGNMVTYQNEQANTKCVSFPEGFILIGVKTITSIGKTFCFLTNPITGNSEIGYILDNTCEYVTLVYDSESESKLNFSVDNPIHKVIVRISNCSVQLYWTDGLNPRRYLNLEELPWKEIKDPNNEFKFIKQVGILDANKLLVQPNFSIPEIEGKQVTVGGKLKAGTYQFAIQYANEFGEGYTSYYNVTNPIGIFQKVTTPNFDFETSNAIEVSVSKLDTTGLYEYFNIAVIKTINNIPSVQLVATLPITASTARYTYTGVEQNVKNLTIYDIFEKYQYYDTAQDIFEVDGILGWANLKKEDEYNLQQIWSKVKLQWETHKIPYNQSQSYNNGLNLEKYRSYMRDEVYALEGCFILKNGEQLRSCHIPGRIANEYDLYTQDWGEDNAFTEEDNCQTPEPKKRWEIYNTASKIGYSQEFLDKNTTDECYVGPYEYGNFAYWESSETYPKNPDIWGDLAGMPIRHHKFPDLSVTKIYSQDSSGEFYIYPIGIKVDINSIYDAIKQSNLPESLKSQIAGFKITRGNRASNKSIIAKGLLHNVGRSVYYDLDNKTILGDYYYPNYPYNDLRKDPFYTTTKLKDHEGFNYEKALEGFYSNANESRSKFTFHSPDTHFSQPSLFNQGSYLKLETVEYGKASSHFVKVKDNAEYKFLTPNTVYAAAGLGAASGLTLGAGQFGWPEYSMAPVASTYTSATELFEKLVPYTNFGYSFNSVGSYSNSYVIPNNGYKNRRITFNKYLTDGFETVENGKQINNFHRESSVYVSTESPFKFTHEYDSIIPQDTSRYNLSTITSIQSTTPSTGSSLFVYKFELTDVNYNYITPGRIYQIGTKRYIVDSCYLTMSSNRNQYFGFFRFSGWVALVPEDGTSVPSQNSSGNITSDEINTTTLGPAILEYGKLTEIYDKNAINTSSPDYGNVIMQKINETNISSYYGSLKRYIPSQWGRMYSYETIDTGYYQELYTEKGNPFTRINTVFGGDIFINRFAYKSKLPFFRDNSITEPNQTDIAYDEIGNIAYPMFWLSTKPSRFDLNIREEVDKLADEMFSPGFFDILGNIVSGGLKGSTKAIKLLKKLFEEVYTKIGVKNINFDQASINGIIELGRMYLFAYGIPYYFCESEVNVDYRQAYNEKEGNFYPNIGSGIPDDWFQEITVPIKNDNTYYYNQTYSKQNKENYYAHIREDWDPTKKCFTYFPNRAIWSDKSSEIKNNWLTYRPISMYDFPKSYGEITSIDNLEHKQMLVRYYNNSQLYNGLLTVDVSKGLSAYLGNSKMFSETVPLDLGKSDIGYAGSQHKMLVKTEYGHIFADSVRGTIFLLPREGSFVEISAKGMSKWFKENLPFNILKYYSSMNVDNNFNAVGLHGTYDAFYKRFILTKLDYSPKYPEKTQLLEDGFYYNNGESMLKINVDNQEYFNNLSWTISYSFVTNSWISFHSYMPNYYINYPVYFQSGIKNIGLWNHNKTMFKYNNYYNKQYPYILEYPFVFKFQDEILQNVKEYCNVRKYETFDTYYEPSETIFFNKSILYNEQQCSGILNLIPKPKNNLSVLFSYPKYNLDSKDILVTKSDNFYNYNTFWNINTNENASFFNSSKDLSLTDKELKSSNLDYTQRNFKKGAIRGKNLKIRHILDNRNDVKIISRFILNNTVNSYK